ncbi:Pentatricopeptide repeat-containing protein [Cardamine amara subsp. amara]|uniref:Pentatricopeptide repeat-containing protein n=1 Tax=Cardamine amara subsp. amara TaxID=228776 RepID=A0ABD0Z3L7_CARAN
MRMLETSATFLRGHFSRRIFTIPTTTLNRLINDHLRDNGLVEARRLFNQNPTLLDKSTWNMMITAYVQRGLMLEAHEVFDQMPVRDVVSWNTMFLGLKKTRDPERVIRFFLEMRRSGLNPDELTIPAIIDAVSGSGFKVLIMQIHTLAIRLGLSLSAYTGSSLLRGYTSLRNLRGLERVFEDILLKDVVSWNVLITGYMKLGFVEDGERAFSEMPERNIITWHTMLIGFINNTKIDKARELFNQMGQKNVFSWTVMINGYVQSRELKVALMLFQEMVESGNYRPSHYTFSTVLKACAASSSLLMGKQVHSMITKRGMACDVVLSTSLIDMYAKAGDITAASGVFKFMPMKNPASWNSMIGGLARHGLGVNALEEFKKMIESGYKPDQVTFINLLSACAHTGLVEEGEKQFMLMGRFGIAAEKEHYACMVDLLGRAGQLDKAERLIKGMPFEPDVVIWGALLGACGLHSCLELGEVAAEGISRLRREHPAAYDVLCRVRGDKGDWTSVMELRKLMKKTKAKKQDASSWIETLT